MIFGALRILAILLVVMTVVYISLSLYSRSVRRQKLGQWFEEEREKNPGISPADKDEYIRRGLVEYDNSLRPKLILGVYIIPLIFFGAVIYLNAA